MKKFVSLLLALMMALGMTALAEESKDQLARIQETSRGAAPAVRQVADLKDSLVK